MRKTQSQYRRADLSPDQQSNFQSEEVVELLRDELTWNAAAMWDQWRAAIIIIIQTSAMETMFPWMEQFCPWTSRLGSTWVSCVFKNYFFSASITTRPLLSWSSDAAWLSYTLLLLTHHVDIFMELLDHDSEDLPGQLLLSYEEANALHPIKRH